MLVLGAVISAPVLVQLVHPISLPIFGTVTNWPTGLAVTAAFGVLWLMLRQRAARRGLKYPAGFGIAAMVGLLMNLSPFVLVILIAGPFVVFGPALLAAGIRLRNDVLVGWALVIGGIGIIEGFFGITNRLPSSIWAGWEHLAIYLSLGLLTLLAGSIMRIRESRVGDSASD